MRNQIIMVIAVLSGIGCDGGLEPAGDAAGLTSSSSSVFSSASSEPTSTSVNNKTYLDCGICDVNSLEGRLVVVSQSHYQDKLKTLLGVELNQLDETAAVKDPYTASIARFSGQALFADDEFRAQRIELAYSAFYKTAERIADDMQAVNCGDMSEENCANLFINDFVEPLYERSLSVEESDGFRQIFNRSDLDRDEQQRLAMISAFSSPQFLFRKEAGNE